MAERTPSGGIPSFAFEMLRKVLRDLPAGILLISPDGTITLANRTAADLLRRPEGDLVGANVFSDPWSPLREDGTPYGPGESPLAQALVSKVAVRNVIVGVPGAQNPTWLLLSAEPEFSAEGDVRQVVCSFLDVTEGRRAEEEIEHLAYHDSLTGLPNRLLFADRIEVALSKARYSREALMVLVVDLDRFKLINDSLGHKAGDALLQQTAARLRHCIQDGDTVARLGGDQFLILMPRIGSPSAIPTIAERILEALRRPFHIDNRELFVTGSIGISLFPDDGDDVQTLLQCADTAMNRVKREGRDAFMLYRPDMNARARERMKLETSLRRALERTEFLLNYQPQIDLASGQIVGAEALLRWRRGDKVVVPPSDFISILEETGLIVSIGEWVLRTAAAQVRAWQAAGLPLLRLGINLSARQFQHAGLVDAVRKVLSETGLPARSLLLEITESVAMERAAGSLAKLAELKRLGIQLALDDFGTGYSSLSYLKRFPIDVLKIDQVFVRGVEFDPKDAALGATSIAMAHGLNLRVIAEGVETEGQREFLRRHGCDEIQGFLVARPLSPEGFRKLLG
ncbi:MAG TPA: EAL domain-containing protein [Thermoanaerobaculia bacterium]|nr:EAL domain-containing protein [Thermoanaerobaculia bacterium]